MIKKSFFSLFMLLLCFSNLYSFEDNMDNNYYKLCDISTKITLLNSTAALLSWDQETYMPANSVVLRGEQIALLNILAYEELTSDTFKNLLQSLIPLEKEGFLIDDLDAYQKANLKEWKREYLKAIELPKSFVKEYAITVTDSAHYWKKAKEKNDFSIFKPYLEKIVDLSRKKAHYLGYEDHPYDALLDIYEPMMTTKKLDQIFDDLKKDIIPFIQQISEKTQIDTATFNQSFSISKQFKISHLLLKLMGINKDNSRIDTSTHPFTMGLSPNDVRLTTKIEKNNVFTNITSVLHEGGHTLYELGLPSEYFGTPVGEAISLGIHESQSRFWERIIGGSKSFSKLLFPILQKTFPKQLSDITYENWHQAMNKVEPTFIRIESDEITYPLHIVIRYEIEKALMERSIEVDDVPKLWNDKMQQYLGITPPSDAKGCLQDIHWSSGLIGYFPTYALGNLYSGQLFYFLTKQYPDWEERIENNDLSFINKWLTEKIYKNGKLFYPEELIQKATNEPLSAKYYIDYLKGKYKEIYDLED